MTNQIELLKDVRRPIPGYEGIYSLTGAGLIYTDARIAITITGIKRPRKEMQLRFTQIDKQVPFVTLSLKGVKKYWNMVELLHRTFPEYSNADITKVSGVSSAALTKLPEAINSLPGEEWRVVKSMPFLMVSNLGRIKRLAYSYELNGKTQSLKDKIVAIRDFGCYGWTVVGFSVKHRNVSYGNVRLPRLVYEAFIGELKKHTQIRYRDNNYRNVTVENIYVNSK